jgi:two-component system, NtrC family, sensor kinase
MIERLLSTVKSLDQESMVSTMEKIHQIRVAIVGAGRGGRALLDLFHKIPSVEIVGMADRDPTALGLRLAQERQVPVTSDLLAFVRQPGIDLILNVTGDPEMEAFLRAHKPPTTEFLSGVASRLLWQVIQHQSTLQGELMQAEKLAGIGSFSAGIAHDINNPLQLIMGLAENLADERNIQTIRTQAHEIVEAVKRTTAICRDLTRYSRQSSPQDDTVVLLNGKLDEALKIARYAAKLHDIEIVKRYTTGAAIRGNPDELLHVFVNLITNAVHAMEQVGGTLTLETRVVADTVDVRIADTGCGIPAEKLDHIFEPFFTTKAPGKGTGLGLYNVRHIVTQMHGNISVDSEIDKGTTFTLTFLAPDKAPERCQL